MQSVTMFRSYLARVPPRSGWWTGARPGRGGTPCRWLWSQRAGWRGLGWGGRRWRGSRHCAVCGWRESLGPPWGPALCLRERETTTLPERGGEREGEKTRRLSNVTYSFVCGIFVVCQCTYSIMQTLLEHYIIWGYLVVIISDLCTL